MNTELSIRNLKHRMENLSEWAMYKDGIGKLHIESFIKELSEIEDNATSELTTLRAQLAEAREVIEPFAAEAGMWGSKTSDGETPIIRGSDGKGEEAAFTVGDLRKAQKWYDKVTTA